MFVNGAHDDAIAFSRDRDRDRLEVFFLFLFGRGFDLAMRIDHDFVVVAWGDIDRAEVDVDHEGAARPGRAGFVNVFLSRGGHAERANDEE